MLLFTKAKSAFNLKELVESNSLTAQQCSGIPELVTYCSGCNGVTNTLDLVHNFIVWTCYCVCNRLCYHRLTSSSFCCSFCLAVKSSLTSHRHQRSWPCCKRRNRPVRRRQQRPVVWRKGNQLLHRHRCVVSRELC